MKNRQIYFTGVHKAELLETEIPSVIPPGDVLAETVYTVISGGTERACIMGMDNTPKKFPMTLGYCGVGYVVKTGDDVKDVKKGVTAAEIIEAGQKLKRAGMVSSITLISGLGGKKRLKEHAINSAKVISAIKPEYLGFLTLMVEPGTELYTQYKAGEFELLGPHEVLEEMKLFIENVDSEGTVFRANHASNYVPLKGTFNKDNALMLKQIDAAEKAGNFRPEMFRGI